ncbi:sn-glycerol-3-phosphate dehydrogenase (anaerobic), small subunit [Haemophilus influenzae]|uniref:sn-glycerol-3-phosphate dehydrogenase (Anaerobic), small subunit n=1 Tax=Haemophilus influenzae TaxID=727 RepID=A0A2X1PIA3_HAEIF|nr:sn-glycerol-3-phosphate dehydrogenase (anaerobic), small subunit [Haemophilus influenzae]
MVLQGLTVLNQKNYEISQSIGKNLFDNINEGGFDYVISECQTCKWQIDMSSNVTCIHPLTLLCMSMDA